tara:strand:- start:15957 stop:16142 length:186 start_codon:yes stop_codon:yes gene_type:complete
MFFKQFTIIHLATPLKMILEIIYSVFIFFFFLFLFLLTLSINFKIASITTKILFILQKRAM